MTMRMLREAEGLGGAAGAPAGAGQAGGELATGAAAGVAAEAGAAAVTTPAASVPDWTSTLDDAGRQLVQAKGWKTPVDAIASYANLEQLVGVEKLPLPPKGADGNRDFANWDGWSQLGVPETPDAYSFKLPEGRAATPADEAFHQALRPGLHAAKLAPWQVDILNETWNSYKASFDAVADKAAAEAKATLQREWGPDRYPAEMDLANRAVRQVFGADLAGATQVRLADGRYLLDDVGMAKAFAKLGELLGEDQTIEGGAGGSSTGMAMTPAAADAEIKRIRGEAYGNPKHAVNDKNHPEYDTIHDRLLDLSRIAGKAG